MGRLYAPHGRNVLAWTTTSEIAGHLAEFTLVDHADIVCCSICLSTSGIALSIQPFLLQL